MPKCNSLEEVREFFSNDRFATENGAVIDDYGEGYAKCSLKITDRHRNALGALMGGVSFMLVDFVVAVASNWDKPDTVSLNSNITFCGTLKGDTVTAEAKCIKNGRSTTLYSVNVTDNLGNLIAVATMTGFRKA